MTGLVVSFVAGLVFALGLAVSGMADPAKIVGFLDVTGRWDPSLAFVMAGAVGVYLPVYFSTRRRARPLLGERFVIPAEVPVDARLVGGAAIFGVGWGLSGYCPGPAIVSVGGGVTASLYFIAGMLGAMTLYEVVRAAAAARRNVEPHSGGFKPGIDADKLNQLADQLEVEDFTRR